MRATRRAFGVRRKSPPTFAALPEIKVPTIGIESTASKVHSPIRAPSERGSELVFYSNVFRSPVATRAIRRVSATALLCALAGWSVAAQAEVKVLRGGDQAVPAAPSAPPASVPQAVANPDVPVANAPNPRGMVNPDGSFWIADPATERRFDCEVGPLRVTRQREIVCTARPQPTQEPALAPAP